jgi:para-aminobenzoate synthetase component 1
MTQAAILHLPWRDPAAALAPFADEPHALMFGGQGEDWAYLMRRPQRTLTIAAGDGRDAFAALAEGLGERVASHHDGPPFQGGWAGLAAYELGAQAEPMALPRHADWPDLVCGLYLQLLAFDRRGRRVLAIGRGEDAAQAQAGAREAASWLQPAEARPVRLGRLAQDIEASSGEAYEDAVAQVVRRIEAGEIFQANIARRWRGRLAAGAGPYDLFLRLAGSSPAPLAGYYRLSGRAVVSNSPERFVRAGADGRIEAKPIKGTRPRGGDPREDAAQAAALLADPKDRAENLMIVDLMRNDLSRVCRPGSVRAPDLFRLESFTNVHHLVSTVTGQLQDGVGPAQVLRAVFPPGSITGAPKVQAMKVIRELEPPRGPYCGSLFWAGLDGAMDSSVLIRTVACAQDEAGWRYEAGAGAGLVADSQPRMERLETEAKIDAIRRTLMEPASDQAPAAPATRSAS